MTANDAMRALTYLRHAFGGFPLPEPEERAHLRLFRSCTIDELQEAINELVQAGGSRRPSPAEVAERVRSIRRRGITSAVREPWPDVTPDDVKRHLDAIRKQLAEKGAR